MNARTGSLPWNLSGRTKSPEEMEEWWKARKQTEMDKDLVKAYYGDREAFDRVREFIAQKETEK